MNENWGIYYEVDGMYCVVQALIFPPQTEGHKFTNWNYRTYADAIFDIKIMLKKEISVHNWQDDIYLVDTELIKLDVDILMKNFEDNHPQYTI